MDEASQRLSQRAAILTRVANRLNAARIATSRKPAPFALALLTDERIENLTEAITALPKPAGARSAVIFRHYRHQGRDALAQKVAATTRSAGHLFFVAGDAALAVATGADGLHLPQWQLAGIHKPDGLLLSAACHDLAAIRTAESCGADCIFLSPVFATESHPDNPALGIARFRTLTAQTDLPTLALGGINGCNAEELLESGAAGLAAVSALSASA